MSVEVEGNRRKYQPVLESGGPHYWVVMTDPLLSHWPQDRSPLTTAADEDARESGSKRPITRSVMRTQHSWGKAPRTLKARS